MDFWIAYVSIGAPLIVALGAIVKNSPELYLAIRPSLKAIQAGLIGVQFGILIGAMLTANHINEKLEVQKLSATFFASPPLSIYVYPATIVVTLVMCLPLADLAFNFFHANPDQVNKDRKMKDSTLD